MSRAVIEKALGSKDAGASLVAQALTGLGITDPKEHARASEMLASAINYYDGGKRGHQMDRFFEEAQTLENAIATVATGYRATNEDIEAFTEAMDGLGSVMAGQETLEDLYPEDDGEEKPPSEEATEVEQMSKDELEEAMQGKRDIDHRGDPTDQRWRDRELPQPVDRSSGVSRAGWQEPELLPEGGVQQPPED